MTPRSLFKRDRMFIALTAKRFGIRQFIYNERGWHLALWLIMTGSFALGLVITNPTPVPVGDSIFWISAMLFLGAAIFMAVTAVTVEYVKKNSRTMTIRMSYQMHITWLTALLAKYPDITGAEGRRAEAWMVQNNQLWREDYHFIGASATELTAGMRDIVNNMPTSVLGRS